MHPVAREIKQLCIRGVARLTGSRTGQRLLEANVFASQYFMGIGSGGGVEQSGEVGLVRKLAAARRDHLCIFDVGANTGSYIDGILPALARSSHEIHAFEPSSWTFARLAEKHGSTPAVMLNNAALGRTSGRLELYSDRPGSGIASLTRRRMDHFGVSLDSSETVRVETLDGYCSERGIGHVDLLKLDVEGHELDVLAGAEDLFAARAIDFVVFEFGGCNIDTRVFFQDFFYFFREQGMKLSRITPSGNLYPLPKYREIDEQFRTMNVVAARESQQQ